ncbi:MAG: type III-A CRISPR-associated CARF protein Csm6 [Clostridia bacterium]|jgi:hypothetical protein
MAKCVLYSPIGMTDPTRGFRDGAFIHICRFYRPHKAYLYMSAEICRLDSLDNRYESYLQKLCEKLGFHCAVEKIKHEKLVDVHDFDAFYFDFTRDIQRVIEENPDSEILLNLSSGTPQMKAALRMVCNLSNRRLIPIQVSTPVKKANIEMPVGESFDLEIEWELNEDNTDEHPTNRCTVVRSENFQALIKGEMITKHVAAYDYRAALSVAETIPDYMDPRALKLIQAACQRLTLNTDDAEIHASSVGYELLPVKGRRRSAKVVKNAVEYILTLQIKLIRGEFADFIRGISPILTTMFELYLDKKCGINVKNYYKASGSKKILKLSRTLLPPGLLAVLDDEYSPWGYKDSPPSAANLAPLISAKGDMEARALAKKLREIEENARNLAAHEIVAVTDKWIADRTGHTTEEILKMLKDFLSMCAAVPRDAWKSYEQLNETIINIPMLR